MASLAIIILIGETHAWATASTHIWGPSTDIQAFKLWHITSDFYTPTEKKSLSRIPPVINAGLTVGVLPFKNLNAEIGFDYKSGLGIADNYPIYFNIKVGIPENAFGRAFPALAAGIFDIGLKKNMTNYDVSYIKAAKTIKIGRFSLGYFSGNRNMLINSAGKKDNAGIMAVWERTMTEISNKLWFCAEYMGTKCAYGTFNIGGSWKFAQNVGVLLGYDFYNNPKFIDTATVQVDIDFQ